MSDESDATEFRMEALECDEPESPSNALRSTEHPAVPLSCNEIILIPSVLPVLAGMTSVVQPFCRVIAVRCG